MDFEVETFVAHVAGTLPAGGNATGGHRQPGISADTADTMLVAHALRAEGFDASEDGTGRGTPLVPVPFDTTQITSPANGSNPQPGDPCHGLSAKGLSPAIAFAFDTYNQTVTGDTTQTLCSRGDTPGGNAHLVPAVAFDLRGREGGAQFEDPHDTANIRAASGGSSRSYVASTGVRRLMPVECERLQGFPDHFTAIPYRWRKVPADEAAHATIEGRAAKHVDGDLTTDCMADGPRYKALGNSMPVNMIRFYLERVERMAA